METKGLKVIPCSEGRRDYVQEVPGGSEKGGKGRGQAGRINSGVLLPGATKFTQKNLGGANTRNWKKKKKKAV